MSTPLTGAMLRRYASDTDLLSEFKTHLALGQWEVVEAFVRFQIEKENVKDILESVALQPQLNSYCLQQNIRSPEHLAFLSARCLGDEKLSKDAAFRSCLREIPQLNEDIKYLLLESFTNETVPEQRVLNALRQCCLLPQVPVSLFVVLDILGLPHVALECILQVCLQIQQTNTAWSIDQLTDKLQELVCFASQHDNVPNELLCEISSKMVEIVLPKRPDKLLSMAIGCRNLAFQKKLLNEISEKECILSKARAQRKHFLEVHLDEIVSALITDEKLPNNLPGINLRPLALQFAWNQLPPEVVFSRLDELERLYPDDVFILRLARIVRECRLINSITKSSLIDLVAQRQTQSILRVVHSTGALKGMKDAQVMHIVKDPYQSQMLCGYLALKHACVALYHSTLISERKFEANSVFRPRRQAEAETANFHSAQSIVKYIEDHGPDVSFEALVEQELNAMEDLIQELPNGPLKVEVLEDLFSLLFVTHRDLQDNEEESEGLEDDPNAESSSRYELGENRHFIRTNGFLASKKFISALLSYLDKHVRSTKLKFADDKSLLTRLEDLLKYIVDARWRLDLVEEKLLLSIKCVQNIETDELTNSSSRVNSTPPKSRRKTARQRTKLHTAHLEPRAPQASVVELMLSTMDALMRHCLWKADYKRAQQVAILDTSDLADTAELDFCVSMPLIEEELLQLQNDKDNISAIFVAVESFLQARALTTNVKNLCRFYLNLAFTTGLKLGIAHHFLAHVVERSKDSSINSLQAIHRASLVLSSVSDKLSSTNISLDKALQLSTCDLSGDRLKDELLFWRALDETLAKVSNCLTKAKGSSNNELHQEFFRLAKLTGTGIRKYHTRLTHYNFDFLRALYAHSRQVYKALEEKQQTLQTHVAVQQKSYFSVLEECSPSMTLLKLILQDHVPPNKLEEFAAKMKLNITQCVSKEILPNVYMRSVIYSDSFQVRVLNSDGGSSGGRRVSQNQFSRNAAFVGSKLLSQMIDILAEKFKSDGKDTLAIERYESLREVAFSPQYERWRESTRELANVDLTKLKSVERIPFFLNVAHCLILDRLLYKCKKNQPFVISILETQIDDSLYAYEIGCMGVVTLLQLKYSVLFRGHSLPPLGPPLTSLAEMQDYPFLPADNILTVYSFVQCLQDDPPLRVFENEQEINEGFSRAVLKVNVDVANKTMYVPWQTREIVKGNFFKTSDRDLLKITLLKMGGAGFTVESVKPTKFFLNLNPATQCTDLCERKRRSSLDVPPSVLRYMEQHCAPIGLMLNPSVETRTSALDRILGMLPEAKQTVLSGNVHGDIWKVLESSYAWSDPLSRMLQCIDLCDAISGGRIVTSKLFYLKQLIVKELSKSSYRYALRIDENSQKVQAFLDNYITWTDKDIDLAGKALKSLVPSDDPKYGDLTIEIERIYLYQSLGRLLQVDWKSIQTDIPWVVDKLRSNNRFDFIHKIAILGLVDPNDEQLMDTVTELNACYYFSQAQEKDYVAGLKIVDSIQDSEKKLSFCRKLLDKLTPNRGKLYLLRYLIFKYSSEEGIVKRLETQALSLEALLVIPLAQRWDYNHLEGYPELIIELFLMNGHLDFVGKVLETSEYSCPEFVSQVDTLCEVFAKRALELNNMTTAENRRASMATVVTRSVSLSAFVMPTKAPSMKEWVRDEEITKCMICQTKFSLLIRKHHCRRCGRIICKECSSRGRLPIEEYGKVPVRVCNDCFQQTTEPEIIEATEAIEHFTPNTLSKRNNPIKIETTWRLKEPTTLDNRDYNENTRRVFWYERAPSVSLCLSILDRHSNPETAAEFILSLCDRLVALLVFPSEIDYGLVIAMLQTLLIKARFNLLQQRKQDSLEWCESYLQTLDLLKLLVKDNCQDLIPKELLIHKDSELKDWINVHRKLRDRLLEAERFQLAVEVSSKCNLEKNVVLASWGLSMLKAGDWAAAREKLVYCLKQPKDLNNSKSESPLLKDILNILQSANYVGVTKSAAVFCALANLKNIRSNGLQQFSSVDLEINIANECWFYLENFACHSTIISFLMKNDHLLKALEYCVTKRCSNETFIEQIFLPCLRHDNLEELYQDMKSFDNFISKFSTYLLSLCKYLDKHGFSNTLYRIQIFLEDWVRAAMTSINFFEREIASLSMREICMDKLHYLVDAKKYLELFLARSISGQTNHSIHLTMPIKEVNRHLSTVALQMDAVRFFARKEEAQNGVLISLRNPDAATPTLFSRFQDEKHDLAAMIILNGSNVEEGFGLCIRIVHECQLDGMEVLQKVIAYFSRDGHEVNLEEIERLSHCVEHSGYNSNRYDMDKVIISVITNLSKAKSTDEDKMNYTIDSLLKLVKDDNNRIAAYTESGRLRSAYMLAVRLGQKEAVRTIREKATKLNQPSVYKMCDKWLQTKRDS